MDDREIGELRNLGPACEKDLHAVGIFTAEDIRKLGVEGTLVRLMQQRQARNKNWSCFNATYLYALYGAIHDCDWRNIPEQKKTEFKMLTARLRTQTATQKAKNR